MLQRILFSLLLFCVTFPAQTQTIDWRNYVDKTFVFEINAEKAEKLLRSERKDSLLLKMTQNTQPLTSFPKEKSGNFIYPDLKNWKEQPKQGHFIFADIYENKVNYQYINIIPFQVFLFKEYDALTLQVVDEKGKIRSNANVTIKKSGRFFSRDQVIKFDPKSRTYTISENSKKENRILSVELDGFETFFDLEKQFPERDYRNYNSYTEVPQFYSYLITDKNKYKPGETVRFKSYALSTDREPLADTLSVLIDSRKIMTLEPYHPGGYADGFQLHDSLKLRLDKNYSLNLLDKEGRIVANTRFRYEDYELKEMKLNVKLQSKTHYYPDTNRIEITATDVNGLLLQDVKADILIKRRHVNTSYTDLLILPDTLMYKRIDLDNASSTRVDIPHTLLGESDCSYTIQVRVVNFDNKELTYYNEVNFYRYHYDITCENKKNVLCFDFQKSGKSDKVKATIRYGNSDEKKEIMLPHREFFDPAIHQYHIDVPKYDYHKKINVSELKSGLELTGGIAGDSLSVLLENPLKLDVSWYFYQGGELLKKGSGTKMEITRKINQNYTYYVDLFYTLGGYEKSFRRIFSVKEAYLTVDMNVPDRIYPGQQVDVTVKVENAKQKPVKNVDLTAFSVNSQLGYSIPDLPYYGKRPAYRKKRPGYLLDDSDISSLQTLLDYAEWNRRAKLDTMNYYRFTYPYNGLFSYTINTPDSTAQFAPYIMKNGSAVNIYVIEVNDKPVYFSWTEQPKHYSFPVVGERKYKITLRLHDRVILLDSMQFEAGKKTIFSLDLNHLPVKTKQILVDEKDKWGNHLFTSNEKDTYRNLISNIEVKNRNFTYLKQGGAVYPVYSDRFLASYRKSILTGPVPNGKTDYNGTVTYNHKNGYAYEYEDNVVYKSPYEVCPGKLIFSSSNNFSQLNKFHLSQEQFNEWKEYRPDNAKDRWHPRNIGISLQKGIHLNFRLPEEKDSSGVANLMFRNRETAELIFANTYTYAKGKLSYPQIPAADYDVILLYNNGKYLVYENIPVRANRYLALNMTGLDIHQEDSTNEWLAKKADIPSQAYNGWDNTTVIKYEQPEKSGHKVTGIIHDEDDEPLIGASIRIKDTKMGTAANYDGEFELFLPEGGRHELIISYIGYKIQTIKVTPNSHISVTLEKDTQVLKEVSVVGYGSMRKSDITGSASSLYLSSSLNNGNEPVEEDPEETETKTAEEILYEELMQLDGLRKNFSDVGFWEPRLYTDKNGLAVFKVTFPDNITQWDAVVYAMNSKLQTGTFRKPLKSYKPLMAELKTPSFLVAGDSAYLAANIRNYLDDKDIQGSALFLQNQDTLMNKTVRFSTSHRDNPPAVAANTDSITTTYLFTRNDGYSDGEERVIPIIPQGTEVAKGTLSLLRNGDKLEITAGKNEEIFIDITAKQLDIYMDAAAYLTGYKHACNEQLASKLIGLLLYKKYRQYMGEEFKSDKNVIELIERLTGNRNSKQMWSWWGNSDATSYWISTHVMKALLMAKEAGYTVTLDLKNLQKDYSYMEVESLRSDVGTLYSLYKWDGVKNYAAAVDRLEKYIHKQEAIDDSIARQQSIRYKKNIKRSTSYLKEKLQLWEIRRQQNLGYVSDSISKYLKEDIFGAVYCSDGINDRWYSDELATTLIAYQIIKNDSALQHLKEPMQLYILGTKQKYNGWNTYQAANIVSTVLPDLLYESGSKRGSATVILSGKESKTLNDFPYKTVLTGGERLQIEKRDGNPVIYSAYTLKRITENNSGDAFEISTVINNNSHYLTTGEKIKITASVKVKQKNAEHVMIEIPVPAGCSYASKPTYRWGNEVHREYYKDKTIIFCERLPEGIYDFSIELLPRFSGSYTVNPAKIEMMYFPVINANNAMERVWINDK